MVHGDVNWVPFSLTHVAYPKGDIVGWFLAFISLTPFFVFNSFVTLVVFKRELDTIFFITGQLLNEVLNVILKNIIRQQRPDEHQTPTSTVPLHRPNTYGMPSQHSQFMSFFTTFSILFILLKMKHKPFYFRYPLVFALTMSVIAVVYSRVYLLYHTWAQVLVGLLVGCLWGLVWFNFQYRIIRPLLFDLLLTNPIAKFFGLTCYEFPTSTPKRD